MLENYEILSGNQLTAVWKDRQLIVYNKTLLPLFLKNFNNADKWLESRSVDSHRANSRLLKKALRLSDKDDISTVLAANAVTITDNYWVRPIGSTLRYEDVSFHYDYFAKITSNIALRGSYTSFNYIAESGKSSKHELTNIGSFEKCWKMIEGRWWLFKKATQREMFSELFIYRLCKKIGINAAVYEKAEDGIIRSLDFTDHAAVNFEPANTFMGDNEDYNDVILKLRELCPQAIPDYIRMIFLDTIVANPDRHTGNFGLLRNTNTGELIGLAPCFDHNMALISRDYPKDPKKGDLLINLFSSVLKEKPEYREYLPDISESTVREVIGELHMKVRTQVVVDLIMARYERLKST